MRNCLGGSINVTRVHDPHKYYRSPFGAVFQAKMAEKPRQCWSLAVHAIHNPKKHMTRFTEALNVFETKEAARYAGALFQESFNSTFPVPVAYRILDTQIQLGDWRQYVAIYTWPDGTKECVGFCNWIKYKEAYLGGGLVVQKNFYRRLSKAEFTECSGRGGIAQIVMETAHSQLTDCDAHFGYCGDLKALRVDLRAGYVPTDHPHLLVKWMRALPERSKQEWINDVTRIGPF